MESSEARMIKRLQAVIDELAAIGDELGEDEGASEVFEEIVSAERGLRDVVSGLTGTIQ